MRRKFFVVFVLSFSIMLNSTAMAFSPSARPLNRITGQVFDEARNPVPDVQVQLLNDLDSVLSQTRTNSAGMFSFLGVSSGRFQVRVLPLKEPLIAETKEVEVRPLYANGNDSVYLDFYLRYYKKSDPWVSRGTGEVIFAQEVTESARRLYVAGIEKLERGNRDALIDFRAAVKIFPLYFDALNVLGRELVKQGKYAEAYPYLLNAIDVNQRSAGTYYSLAFAFHRLNELPAALKAVDACLFLSVASADAHLLRGTILRQSKSLKDAEGALLKASSLYKTPNSEVHWQLAILYNRMGRNKDAILQLEKYLKLTNDDRDRGKIKELIARLKTSQQIETINKVPKP